MFATVMFAGAVLTSHTYVTDRLKIFNCPLFVYLLVDTINGIGVANVFLSNFYKSWT